jgi:hypothetical protein
MNEEHVVLSLLSFYKKEGLDLHNLLDDPLFDKLPLNAKVEAVKNYAEIIRHGMNPSVGTNRGQMLDTIRSFALGGGMTGFGAAAAASKLFKTSPLGLAGTAVGGAVLGATAGAIGGGITNYFESRREQGRKEKLHGYLSNVATNPSDEAALHTLALRSMQTRSGPSRTQNMILAKIKDILDARTESIPREWATTHQSEVLRNPRLSNKSNK